MSSADKLKRFFKKAELQINPDSDEKIFQDVFDAHKKTIKSETAQPVNIGRIIMKSSLTKFTAAAIVIIACIAGLLLIDTTSSIALGDVLQKIEQVKAYKYQYNTNSADSFISKNNISLDTNYETHQIILFSQEHGVKITTEIINKKKDKATLLEVYWLPQKKTLVSLQHNKKIYNRSEIDDAKHEQMMEESYNPHKMVENILNCKFDSLGRSTINGVEVEGFHTNDPNYMNTGTLIKPYDVKLWIDTKTILPVKIEINRATENDEGMHNTEIIIDKFQWDITVEASEFEPVIPDDYILTPDKTVNEDMAIQGLKLYAELTGNYPENLDLDKLTSKVTEILMKDKIPVVKPQGEPIDKEFVKKQIEEMKQTINETVEPIAGAGVFHMLLGLQGKEPAYYGDIITPDDFDQLLMRWKVSDNEYRVIFGNLHAETVNAQVLEELKQSLPKE